MDLKRFWILVSLSLLATASVVQGDAENEDEFEDDYLEDGYYDDDDQESKEPIITTEPKTINVVEGDDIRLECKGKHLKNFAIIWSKVPNDIISVGENILKNDSHRYETIEKETVLIIKNATLMDEGVYNCIVLWNVTIKHKVNVNPKDPTSVIPYITLDPFGYNVVDEGDNMNLTCNVRTEGKQMEFFWLKKNQHGTTTIKIEETTRRSRNRLEAMLMLKAISRQDAGDYVCIFQDDLGKAENSMRIDVNFPPVMETKQNSVHSAIGKSVELRCVSHGQPKPTLKWYKSDRNNKSTLVPLEQRKGYQMRSDRNTHILFITNMTENDFGTYTCEARNGFPKAGVAVIEVVGSPSQPIIDETKTKLGDEHMSYNLVWKVESSIPLETNAVRYRKESENWTDVYVEATRSPNQPSFYEVAYTLHNLAPSTQYEASLLSKNKHGWSAEARIHRFSINGNKYNSETLELNDGKEGKAPGLSGNGLLISASISVFLLIRW